MDPKSTAYITQILNRVARAALLKKGELAAAFQNATIHPEWAWLEGEEIRTNEEAFTDYLRSIGFLKRWTTPTMVTEVRRIERSKDFAPGNLEVFHRKAILSDIVDEKHLEKRLASASGTALRGRKQHRIGEHWKGVPHGFSTRFVALGISPCQIVNALKRGIPWQRLEEEPGLAVPLRVKAAAEGLPARFYEVMEAKWGLGVAAARKLKDRAVMLDIAGPQELMDAKELPEALMHDMRGRKATRFQRSGRPDGIPKGFSEEARRRGVSPATAINRLYRGWSVEEALSGRKVQVENEPTDPQS